MSVGKLLTEVFHLDMLGGLWQTARFTMSRKATVQYPEKRVVLPLRFRGRLVMPIDPDKGNIRCTACMRCVKICPNHSIDVDKAVSPEGKPLPKPASYRYNLGTCIFCNLCVETCPFFAIVMSDEHELATTDPSGLVVDLAAEKYRLSGKKGSWWQKKFRGSAEEA